MKGFKPTGYGPSAGFKFPASFGFTGSTGAYTNVSPYVRQKPRVFKDGGYVSEKVPDPGHATVQRSRPYTEEDRESGGKTPLRPGFKKGGKAKMRKANGGAVMSASPLSTLKSMRRKPPRAPSASTVKEKFAAADGGKVVRGSSAKPFMESLADTPALIKELLRRNAPSSGMARKGADIISGRERQIDRTVDEAMSGKSNYARGGKMKRMGYAKGGGVSREEAKKIAQSTVGEHVKYPAPKGHKGLGAMCK